MRRAAATGLLGAACTAWAAFPLGAVGSLGRLVVIVAGVGVAVGALRLLAQKVTTTEETLFPATWSTLLSDGLVLLRKVGWESTAVISMVALETMHHSRPWHTGLLAVAVVCYLLAVHRAESPVPAALLRREARVVGVCLPLIVVATGVAMVPTAGSGATAGWLEAVAALAAVTAGALALPL